MTSRIGATRQQLSARRFRREVRNFLAEIAAPTGEEDAGADARGLFEAAGRRGLLGLRLAQEVGGRALPYAYTAALIDELAGSGAWGTLLAIIEHSEAALPWLQLGASRELVKSTLEPAVRGDRILALAVREGEGPGLDGSVRAVAVPVEGGYRVRGRKWVTANAIVADAFCTLCASESAGGFSPRLNALVVRRSTEGVRVVRRLERIGLRGAGGAEVAFEDCFVPAHDVLGTPGRAGVLLGRAAAAERVALAIGCVGAARHLWEQVRAAARNTVCGGRPLVEHSRWRRRLAIRRTLVQAAEELAGAAARSMDVDPPDLRLIGMARLFVSRALEDLAALATEFYGGLTSLEGDAIGERIAAARGLAALGGGPESAAESVANLVL